MDTFDIRHVLRKGLDHPTHCEDSFFIGETDDLICLSVFDGCGSGIKSYFASELFAKIMKNSFTIVSKINKDCPFTEVIVQQIIQNFVADLSFISLGLSLSTKEILSTIVFVLIDKKTSNGFAFISGDGCIHLDGEMLLDIEDDVKNEPEYIAYHLGDKTIGDIINTFHVKSFVFGSDISLCTDGIKSFCDQTKDSLTDEVIDYILVNDKFKGVPNMLVRKCNILELQNKHHVDDLAIIRMIKEKK